MIATAVLQDLSIDFKTKSPKATLLVDTDVENLEPLQGKRIRIELKVQRAKRSLDSNAYYWQLITKIADALHVSMSYMHNEMLRKYGQIEIVDGCAVYIVLPDTDEAQKAAEEAETFHVKPTSEVRFGKDGKGYRTYMMLKGSHNFDTKEMSTLIDGTVQES